MSQELYHFDPSGYDEEGRDKKAPEILFHDFIGTCEKDFYQKHHPVAANYLKANTATMLLLQSCFDLSQESFGMEGDLDFDENQRMDEQSDKVMVYALGSQVQERIDEPVYLVIDNEFPKGQFLLYYAPEGEGGGEELPDSLPSNEKERERIGKRILG